jgi:heat shock protein HslJ
MMKSKFLEMKMKKTALFVLALFILTACSSTSPDIAGEWKLVFYGDVASPTSTLPDVDTSIKFENGEMSGNVGCNGFGGSYELSGDKITFNGIMSTMMYCEETSAQEQGVLGVFSDNLALQVQVNADSLTITSADGNSVVNFSRK